MVFTPYTLGGLDQTELLHLTRANQTIEDVVWPVGHEVAVRREHRIGLALVSHSG